MIEVTSMESRELKCERRCPAGGCRDRDYTGGSAAAGRRRAFLQSRIWLRMHSTAAQPTAKDSVRTQGTAKVYERVCTTRAQKNTTADAAVASLAIPAASATRITAAKRTRFSTAL